MELAEEQTELSIDDLAEQVAAIALPSERLVDCALVLYDLETTGLNVKADRIVEIAAQRLVFGGGAWIREGPALELLVNPGISIPTSAVEVHGITDEMVADAVGIVEGLQQLRDYIGSGAVPTIVMAHNGMRFDRHFVRSGWPVALLRFDPQCVRYWGDSISLFKLLSPGRFEAYTLAHLHDELGGPAVQAHRALADVRMMEHVLSCLWAERVEAFDRYDLEDLCRMKGAASGAPGSAGLRNRTLFTLLE